MITQARMNDPEFISQIKMLEYQIQPIIFTDRFPGFLMFNIRMFMLLVGMNGGKIGLGKILTLVS
ncbi:hypothetical protein SEH50133_04921 [Salmonella enterica subsp. houtenae serovar 50:g,z51:- str. 01-0133]|nr:hypothetical protein SEH50133_04921 [Salmonella enterica subsp. houtenae serovar 50:g,z51:- str. 01-0133]